MSKPSPFYEQLERIPSEKEPEKELEKYKSHIQEVKTASTEGLYHEIDAILSLLDGPGQIPQGNVTIACNRLQDLRDQLYQEFR